jgi:hypothetical protein
MEVKVEPFDQVMYYSGVVFWMVCAILGLLYLMDSFLWYVVDVIIKRLKMQGDLLAFCKDRYEKRAGRFRG